MWFKKKKQTERVVAIYKVTKTEQVQFIVRVDNLHVTGGCCSTYEEALEVAGKYLKSDYSDYNEELMVKYKVTL